MTLWTPEPFETDDGTIPYRTFIDDLSDFKFVALDAAIKQVLSVRGLDLVRTEWLKALGEGLHEFRIRHDADEISRMFGGDPAEAALPKEVVLLRVFVHFYGDKVVLLLGGYDKGENPNDGHQRQEIAEARKLLAQFKERQRRARKKAGRSKKRR